MSITPRDRNGRCRACGKPAEAVHHVRGCLFESMERFRDQLSAANDVLAQTIYPNPVLIHTEEGGPTAGIVGNQPKEETMDSFAKAERRRQADVRVQEAQERAAKAAAKFKAAEERADKWEGRAEVAETELRKARAERERLDWPAEPTTRPRVHAQAGYKVGDPLVVSFQRRAGGRDYTYAAVGILPRGIVTDPRLWYVTGNLDHRGQGMAWEALMEWIGEHGRRTLVKATSLQRVAR